MTFQTYENLLSLRVYIGRLLLVGLLFFFVLGGCAGVETIQTEDAICPSPRVALVPLTREQVDHINDEVLLILAGNDGLLKDRLVYLETLISSHDDMLGGC